MVLCLVLFTEGSKSRSCDYAENMKLNPAAAAAAAAASKPQQKLNLDPAGQVYSQSACLTVIFLLFKCVSTVQPFFCSAICFSGARQR